MRNGNTLTHARVAHVPVSFVIPAVHLMSSFSVNNQSSTSKVTNKYVFNYNSL